MRTPLPEKQQKPTKTPSIPYADLARLTIDRLELGKALVGEPASLQVEGTAQSVGERTTSSVVQTISLVILLDALAALFYMEMDW